MKQLLIGTTLTIGFMLLLILSAAVLASCSPATVRWQPQPAEQQKNPVAEKTTIQTILDFFEPRD